MIGVTLPGAVGATAKRQGWSKIARKPLYTYKATIVIFYVEKKCTLLFLIPRSHCSVVASQATY